MHDIKKKKSLKKANDFHLYDCKANIQYKIQQLKLEI